MAGSADTTSPANSRVPWWDDPQARIPDGGRPISDAAHEQTIVSVFGSRQETEGFIKRGRPKLGSRARAGHSPVVRTRLADADYQALARLAASEGKPISDMVREGITLILSGTRAKTETA
ncbi:MAG: hypothetical protein LBG60_14155 [Bifidobacteriaceae bacterium]|jgi:hypothetical protein|nr:hypothetical protein [Bifidobacteriaceae bacterium]